MPKFVNLGSRRPVKIGSNDSPNTTAILDVESTSKGFLPPRLTSTQRDDISSPATGLIIFNTSAAQLEIYNGSSWVTFASGSNQNLWETIDAEFGTDPVAGSATDTLQLRSDSSAITVTGDSVLKRITWDLVESAIDHGSIGGLSDDDHTIYLLIDGSRAMSGDLDLANNHVVNGGLGVSVNQTAHGFSVGNAIFHNGSSYAKADASDSTKMGILVVTSVPDVNNFVATQVGRVTGLSGLAAGEYYFVSQSTPGDLTTTSPTVGLSNPIFFADTTTTGYVLPFRPSIVQGQVASSNVGIVNIDNTDSPFSAAAEATIICDDSSGSITVNLPAAADNCGRIYNIKKESASNSVTVDGNLSETIDGATTQSLNTQYDSVSVISDGTEWWIISDNR